jgi:predicted deacylase
MRSVSTSKPKRPTALGSARFIHGESTQGELVLASDIGATVAAPVAVACGAESGPVLWVQAAIHGGEVGGTLALQRLLGQLDISKMSGSIAAVLAANPLAFRAQTRNSPEDGENMNRLFPGDPDGSITRQMAHSLFEAALATADVAMDLHSGGVECIVPFYALYWEDGSPASEASARYARSAATEVIWRAQDPWLAGAMFTNLTMRGTPSLIVECGGGGAMPDAHIDSFAAAITGVARAMGILPGGDVRQQRYRMIGSCDLVMTRMGGFFEPACAAGDVVARGALIGKVIDVYGVERERIVARKPGFIAAIGRRFLPVHAGALIAELNDDHGFEPAP